MEKLTESELSIFEFYGEGSHDNYCVTSTNGGRGLLTAQELLLNPQDFYIAISLLKGMGYDVSFLRNSKIKIVKFLMDINGREEECVGLTFKDKCHISESTPKQLVDFDLLSKFIREFDEVIESPYRDIGFDEFSDEHFENIKSFFSKMATSSSFAHLAHKKLKEINER